MTETITLNENQINNLFTNNCLFLDENKVLEISDNELFLNINGYTNRVHFMNIQFEERYVENRKVVDFIRNLICTHLNLQPCEVIFFSRYQDEFQFKIQMGSNLLSKVIVYERRKVERLGVNMGVNMGVNENVYNPVTKTIGLYKQLCDSAYFFRWLDE